MIMRKSSQKHSIENVFVLVLFAIFAMTIVAVLALGANQYKSLVERDNNSYNQRIITSYVSAQIRGYDRTDAVKVGGFSSPDVEDEVDTLHLFDEVDGIRYDLRIYYYKGKIYELFASEEADMKPEDGVAVMDAKGLSFEKKGSLIRIQSQDSEGRKSESYVSLRSEESGVEA